jgi:hypothetical protein
MVAPLVKTPVLDSGDLLSRAEFHRRYLARPDLKRAELIGGSSTCRRQLATPGTTIWLP